MSKPTMQDLDFHVRYFAADKCWVCNTSGNLVRVKTTEGDTPTEALQEAVVAASLVIAAL